jgi:hypothetical protein
MAFVYNVWVVAHCAQTGLPKLRKSDGLLASHPDIGGLPTHTTIHVARLLVC